MSPDDIRHFLVVYDARTRTTEVTEFEDYDEALTAYGQLERQSFGKQDRDIVLLGADSLETIKRTHSSYFDTEQHGFERFFKDALAAG